MQIKIKTLGDFKYKHCYRSLGPNWRGAPYFISVWSKNNIKVLSYFIDYDLEYGFRSCFLNNKSVVTKSPSDIRRFLQ